MHGPQSPHFQAAHRVPRYLKGTTGLGLTFKKTGKLDLILYTDSEYARLLRDPRSTTGYCIIFGGNLVSCRNEKQTIFSKSSTKAEFRALSSGIDGILWIRNILQDLNIPYEEPIKVLCNIRSAISIAHDPVYQDRTKHVNTTRFYNFFFFEKKRILRRKF